MYSSFSPDGPLRLWEFIAMVTLVMIVLSQLPTFHSLRHVNLVSLFLSLAYTFIVVGACINAGIMHSFSHVSLSLYFLIPLLCVILLTGLSKNAPPRDYSLEDSKFSVVMSAFTSISIIAAIFGNGILPEIQVS